MQVAKASFTPQVAGGITKSASKVQQEQLDPVSVALKHAHYEALNGVLEVVVFKKNLFTQSQARLPLVIFT